MKKEEWRIGNIILESLPFGSDKIITVDKRIFLRCIDDFQPIPLTEEWLLRFGFEKESNDIDIEYRFSELFSVWRKEKFNVFYLCQYNEINKELINTTQIKYVHSLQNLYFALTGEELILKND